MPDEPGVQLERSSPKRTITLDTLKNQHRDLILEACLGMEAGKLQVLDYDEVAEFFRSEPTKITLAHNMLLVIVARLSGRSKDMRAEFPVAESLSQYLSRYMQKEHPDVVSWILNRVSAPDWKPLSQA